MNISLSSLRVARYFFRHRISSTTSATRRGLATTMAPKRKRTSRTQNAAVEATTEVTLRVPSVDTVSAVQDSEVNEDGNESPLTELEDEPDVVPSPAKKKRRTKKNLMPVVLYEIPPVESQITTFKGRLGYACLNTVLRALKPDPIFCSRTCRIDTILKNGLEFAKELGRQNCKDLVKLIEWNEQNRMKFLRVSSEMFPFASHLKYGYTLDYAAEELKAAGDLAKRYGHRLTAHPGQFTQLASPKQDVVTASVRELDYHCQMFRHMGLDQDSVMIIHMGGVYGDKQTTIARFKENFCTKLTDEIRARLVLENDEICYNTDDLLPVCEELSIPIVFDYHHNWINPSIHPLPELIERINKIWHRKGIKPKQHLSSPRPGAESIMEKRAHADRCYTLPPELPDDMDLMIEAKDKEQAVFHLYRIYGLESVLHENLRPEKPPKPFIRAGDYNGDGETEEADGAESPQKRKARVRGKNKRKAMAEDTDEGSDVAEVGTSKVAKKTKVKVKTGAKQRNNASKVQELMDQEE